MSFILSNFKAEKDFITTWVKYSDVQKLRDSLIKNKVSYEEVGMSDGVGKSGFKRRSHTDFNTFIGVKISLDKFKKSYKPVQKLWMLSTPNLTLNVLFTNRQQNPNFPIQTLEEIQGFLSE